MCLYTYLNEPWKPLSGKCRHFPSCNPKPLPTLELQKPPGAAGIVRAPTKIGTPHGASDEARVLQKSGVGAMGPGKTTCVQTGAIWGFPKIRGTSLGVSITRLKSYTIWGSMLGSPYSGKLPKGVPCYFGGRYSIVSGLGLLFCFGSPLCLALSITHAHDDGRYSTGNYDALAVLLGQAIGATG